MKKQKKTRGLGGVMHSRGWVHRGYQCVVSKEDMKIRCKYTIKHANFWLPREFLWQDSSKEECNRYIDLLCTKQSIECKKIENAGLVTEHIYDTNSHETKIVVSITPSRMMALFRGEEILEVPVDARVRFVPSGGRYVNSEVDAAFLSDELTEEYIKEIRRLVGEGKPILYASLPKEAKLLEKYGYAPIDRHRTTGVNLSIYREETGEVDGEPEAPAAPPPVSETPVSSVTYKAHTETVSLITSNERVPYFVKRLIRDQHLLWSGTSYEAEGPWMEYFRDQARLTALGIHIA